MRTALRMIVLALGVTAGTLLGGCGTGTVKTVSVADTQSTTTSTASASSSSATSSITTTSTSTGGSAATSTSVSTTTGPAFVTPTPGGADERSAAAVLQCRGFSAMNAGDYQSGQTLRVLVGARNGSGGHAQQAFFFVGGRFLGTDTSAPSAAVRVLEQSDTEVTLGYSLYRSGDSLSSPTGGQASVRFQLDNGRLTPLDPIPSQASRR